MMEEERLRELRTQAVLDVMKERSRQFAKWGEQNHDLPTWMAILGEEFGELCQAVLHDQFGGHAAGTHRAEAVQVAAVAIQIIEYIDRMVEQKGGDS